MSHSNPPADEYGGLDKWLKANNGPAPPVPSHDTHTRALAAGEYSGGYGGLGYSYGKYGRLRSGSPAPAPAATPPAAVKWTHVMSAVSGGFQWLEAHGPVGGLPTLDFPELSMFSGCPWGGWGANPIPTEMQHDWDANGKLITGGMPYSEGIYLDINQVLRQQQYWCGRPTNETLAEYIRYEFGSAGEVERLATEAIGIMEVDMPRQLHDPSSQRALQLLQAALPSMTDAAQRSWRWRESPQQHPLQALRILAAHDALMEREWWTVGTG